jgi:hypothetical protein
MSRGRPAHRNGDGGMWSGCLRQRWKRCRLGNWASWGRLWRFVSLWIGVGFFDGRWKPGKPPPTLRRESAWHGWDNGQGDRQSVRLDRFHLHSARSRDDRKQFRTFSSFWSALTGTAFPLEQTAIAVSPYGVIADPAANSAGATLSVVDWSAKQFHLSIPSLGVNTTFTSGTLLQGPTLVTIGDTRLALSNMNYTVFGAWEVDRSVANSGVPDDYIAHLSAFVAGYETPTSAMPTSGTASYSGTRNVAGVIVEHPYFNGVYIGGLERAAVQGDASFTANFATGSVTGDFTNMIAVSGGSQPGVSVPWNDISINASIAAGTSHFSGTTAAAPASGPSPNLYNSRVVVSGSAKGYIDGGFYGPQAEELGAVWSVSDGPITAIGVVGAQ